MISKKEINEMKNLMLALDLFNREAFSNNKNDFLNFVEEKNIKEKKLEKSEDVNIKEMKKVLKKFYESLSDAIFDPNIKTSIEVKKIPNGLMVKKYKIIVNEKPLPKGGFKKFYSIENYLGDVLIENLQVGAAAIKLVELLNNGLKINDEEVLNILRLEEKYSSFREEAIRYKFLWKKSKLKGYHAKCDIYEAKYQNARKNALNAKRKLEHLVGY